MRASPLTVGSMFSGIGGLDLGLEWAGTSSARRCWPGFPCQPVSDAGLKLADLDERWLWPEMRRAVEVLTPTWVVIENVPGLRKRGLATVRDDLSALGYLSRPVVLSACELGAAHARRRLFTLAHAAGQGCRPGRPERRGESAAQVQQQDGTQPAGGTWWADEPHVGRVAYGLPDRVDRIRALGNAVMPQQGLRIGERIVAASSEAKEQAA